MSSWTEGPRRRGPCAGATIGACLLACAMLVQGAAAAPVRAESKYRATGRTATQGSPAGAASKPGKNSKRSLRPMSTAQFVDVTIQRSPSGLKVLAQRHGRLSRSARLPRYAGPFEVLLYSGKRLRDRLHFSFPLTLGGMPGMGVPDLDRDLARGVTAVTVVRIPYDPSLTHIVVRDVQNPAEATRGKLRRPPMGLPPKLPGPSRAASFGPATGTDQRNTAASGSKKSARPPEDRPRR